MGRRSEVFKWVNGVGLVRINAPDAEFLSPSVQTDEMPATEHPGGGIFTSKAKFREQTRRLGWVEVGNEKLSERQSGGDPDPLPSSKLADAIEYAESVVRDPAKLNGWRNRMVEKAEYVRERFRDK